MPAFFVVLFLIFYFGLAYRRWPWAVWLLLASWPAYLIRFTVFGLPSTLLEAMILISFAVWLARNYQAIRHNFWQKIKARRPTAALAYPFSSAIILFLLVSYLAVFVGGFSVSALGLWRAYFFEPILVYILLLNLFARQFRPAASWEQAFSFVVWPLAASAFVLSILALSQKFIPWGASIRFWPRLTSVFPYPNALGLYLGPIVLLLVGWLVHNYCQTGRQKHFAFNNLFIFLTIVVSVLAVFFARSEGALAGLIVGLAVFGCLAGSKLRTFTFSALVLILALTIAWPTARAYVARKATLHDLSGEIRRRQWAETIKMLKSSPKRFVLGAGLAKYQQAVKPYHQPGFYFNKENDPDFRRKIVIFNDKYRAQHWQPVEIYLYPHNIFLNFWTELGLAGAAIFFFLLGKSFFSLASAAFSSRTQKDYLALALAGALVVIFIHGLVDVPYFKNDLAGLFWSLIALTAWRHLRYNKDKAKL